ncbi:ATP-grasp fold amidoligase family protein [Edwardsiella tarda]|uniref:ATP-grasp fold amidoligase family protein n=1 Tax=Edwardsiella tarda TaxID=636 RepID=UPI000BE3242E|nr:ATP-grasp fold amidoligase family protein [Edwardsiella tarda]ATI63197.1 hypothetical protein CPU03_02375 [Edwardsiella tarda]WKS80195.1 hypothetical protein NHU85_10465 [Edwardsiella tarda]
MNTYDSLFSLLAYIVRRKEIPNIIFPKTLSEKILYKKMFPTDRERLLRCMVSDRLKVREYVKNKSPNCSLIEVLWSGFDFSINVWNSLPKKFVLKANHGSKMVEIIDKDINKFDDVYKKTLEWMKNDYYKRGREWVYKELDRLLIAEEFIEFNHEVPPDYKFFCVNGHVAFIQVDLDRYTSHSRNLYSRKFELLPVKYQFKNGYSIPKPPLFERAINIAEELSSDFDFIRVDLYVLNGMVYFGELTNFPGNCLEKFEPKSFDIDMGGKLKLDHHG